MSFDTLKEPKPEKYLLFRLQVDMRTKSVISKMVAIRTLLHNYSENLNNNDVDLVVECLNQQINHAMLDLFNLYENVKDLKSQAEMNDLRERFGLLPDEKEMSEYNEILNKLL